MKYANWNKKIFALLLEQAKGVRSWRQFASDCDISYVQMRKLALQSQENPPRPKLIQKIAGNSFGDIDLEDFMFAAGLNTTDLMLVRTEAKNPETFYKKYRSLPSRDRITVGSFVNFLVEKNEKNEKSKLDKYEEPTE